MYLLYGVFKLCQAALYVYYVSRRHKILLVFIILFYGQAAYTCDGVPLVRINGAKSV